ncbi:unnamed protein product [Heligmosomoides polygyrus]|uniref:Reverse transcriptase domain-containing protein n=1 Tax=Heligmosomoides polygyrus TaxID=6339 RepID=A0A3P7XI45_HELPZ|nr:unnamed protein product [Heligmosomoides polygyrus]
MPLCPTFIDFMKAFDSIETEAVIEALLTQGVPTQYNREGSERGYHISKLFSATLENVMLELELQDMGVKVDGRQLHHLRFVKDIVLIPPSIMQLSHGKTMFMTDGRVSDAPFSLNGTNISECSSYVYLGSEVNMDNELWSELGMRKREAWGTFKGVVKIVKKNFGLRAHLRAVRAIEILMYVYPRSQNGTIQSAFDSGTMMGTFLGLTNLGRREETGDRPLLLSLE